jgi:hypothetical protein
MDSVGAHPSLSLSNGALTGTPMSQKTTKRIPTLADRFLRSRTQRVKRWGLVLGDGISGHKRGFCMMIMEIVVRIQVAKETPKIVSMEW